MKRTADLARPEFLRGNGPPSLPRATRRRRCDRTPTRCKFIPPRDTETLTSSASCAQRNNGEARRLDVRCEQRQKEPTNPSRANTRTAPHRLPCTPTTLPVRSAARPVVHSYELTFQIPDDRSPCPGSYGRLFVAPRQAKGKKRSSSWLVSSSCLAQKDEPNGVRRRSTSDRAALPCVSHTKPRQAQDAGSRTSTSGSPMRIATIRRSTTDDARALVANPHAGRPPVTLPASRGWVAARIGTRGSAQSL